MYVCTKDTESFMPVSFTHTSGTYVYTFLAIECCGVFP